MGGAYNGGFLKWKKVKKLNVRNTQAPPTDRKRSWLPDDAKVLTGQLEIAFL